MKNNLSLNILWLLSDWKFHTNMEILKVWWHRFWWKLHQLKQMWFVFTKEKRHEWDKGYIEYWKLISSPTYTVTNGRIMTNFGKIKRIVSKCEKLKPKLTLWERIKLFF